MKYRHYTNQQILDKSRELLHAFTNRQLQLFTNLLDPDFVWIGDYDSQYTKGIAQFQELIKEEAALPPCEISHEEYSMLTHERHTWITYGRFVATTFTADLSMVSAKVHFTFVWKQNGDSLKLLLANATHVTDSQVQESLSSAAFPNAQTGIPQARIFDRMKVDELTGGVPAKIRIKGLDGNIHFLFPAEILYIKSNDKLCTIYTENGSFVARTTLRNMLHPEFLQIHRSYLVNQRYLSSIRRYRAVLSDGTQLPIGKERYMNIQKKLTGK